MEMRGRLRLVEKKLDFVMKNIRMRGVASSHLTGPDGKPLQQQAFEGSMFDIFEALRSGELIPGMPPEVAAAAQDGALDAEPEEEVNG